MSPNARMYHNDKENGPLKTLLEQGIDLLSDLGPQFSRDRNKLSSLQKRLIDGRFHLAVLGQFKRGKSTLLNALLGEPILPVSVVPLTAVPTFIRFGKSPLIRVKYGKARPQEEFSGHSTAERTAFLNRYVTEEGNPKNVLGIQEVELISPAAILSRGVVLIDTPGIGSTYRHNTQVTLNFLQQCDAAVFIISADPPITEVELNFLSQVRDKVPRFFFVLNKIDYLNAQEREQALSFFRKILAEQLPAGKDSYVFCVSARLGLAAKLEKDPAEWASSGVAELEAHLVDFLVKEKFYALGQSVARRAIDTVEAVLMAVKISLKALQLPQETLEENIAVFEKSLEQAASDRTLIDDILRGDKKRIVAFIEEQAQAIRKESRTFFKNLMNEAPGVRSYGKSLRARIQDAWAEAVPDFFEKKQADLNKRVKARLLEALAPHQLRLEQLIETLRKTAADLFQVPYQPLQSTQVLETVRKPYWVLNTWNTDPLPIFKSMDQRLDDLVRRNVENIRWSTLQNINISFVRFASHVKERMKETVKATKGAMESADTRKQNQAEGVAEEIQRLNRAAEALAGLKHELESPPVFKDGV